MSLLSHLVTYLGFELWFAVFFVHKAKAHPLVQRIKIDHPYSGAAFELVT